MTPASFLHEEPDGVLETKGAFGWRRVRGDVQFGWASCWLTLEINGRTHRGVWRFRYGDRTYESSGAGLLYT